MQEFPRSARAQANNWLGCGELIGFSVHHTRTPAPKASASIGRGLASGLVLGTCQGTRLEALARVGQGYLNTSQTVLKSLRSVDLFDRLWRGAS